jgi:hypothetical protein
MPKFRLNEFRDVARWLDKHLPAPLSFFLKGWLWSLEDRYIDAKVSSAVEKGIAPYKPSDPVVEPPRYHSEPSEVEGLNIIQITNDFTR